jgi:hypothetical protein
MSKTGSLWLLVMCLATAAAAALGGGRAWAQELSMGNVNPARHGTTLAALQFID